ncbi:UDP-3-O-(3-hydroxymyristoyl)glucosamine N-acyltransferase [Coraliomargarita sinensis]|uniref:UDP-3-O-acylglucosamine N-acyltransferase n=1 Tax=Coraliomargarita sinensis TaxID=2174842 RepID=A0A317ZLK9_9BACT|nr:UDP-3-O-(3-hydroxymyristoyl)glucosamine N-acyltransferase [Coraliomargarita sinensis]PXA04709.1 UDP-3-O-(3-hydroxymyristoyl)glucosamine N-acyltransferase [Coraliomargarita sinensis]
MAFVFSLQRILEMLPPDVESVGDFSGDIVGIASLSSAKAGDLSFLGNHKYHSQVETSNASVVLLPKDYDGEPSEGQIYLKVENPSFSLAMICREIERLLMPAPEPGAHPSAVIHPEAKVSPEATIGPLCVVEAGATVEAAVLESQVHVGRHAKISAGTYLFPRVVVGNYCEIGERNRLLPGCVIGSDGYGYEFVENAHQRVPQVGRVVTAADVDVGANSTIDRARFGSTYIGQGTKIDNQVQIAHNVRVGKHCLLVAQVGISGSTEIGDGVVIGGQAGVAGHLQIGDGAMIAGGAAIVKSVEAGTKMRGSPATEMALHNRIIVLQRKLPELFKRFDQLEKSIESREQE